MGATYTRQSSYTDGDTITAAHTNDEFDQLLAAFQASSGHTHDGTANEGGPITKMLGTALTLGDGTSGTDIAITFDGESNDGVLTWMEDEDYFKFSDDILIIDDEQLIFGSDSNVAISYDETTTDSLKIAATEGAGLAITLMADEGDDAGDEWKLNIADGGTLTLGNDIASAGSYVTHLTLTPNSTVANSTLAVAGNLTVGGTLTLGSGAELAEAELEMLDGITAGTVAASKAMVVDANKDIGTVRNLTIDGTFSDGNYTFDTSGNVSGLGTIASGAITSTGIIKTDNTTDATTTTDGSLQTDGGLSVAKDAILGNDVKLLSDSAVLSLGAGNDITFTHDGTTGLTIAATPISIDSTGELHLNSTIGDIKLQDGGVDQIAFDLDGTAGEVIMKPAVDSDDLVISQYDGTEVIRIEDNASLGLVGNKLNIANSSSDVIFKPLTDAKDVILQQYDGNEVVRIADDRRLYFFDKGGEYISSDGTDFTLASGGAINLTATTDVVIPANVGVTFGTGEKIEGNNTDLTVTSGADINLTATSDINVPANIGMTFGDDGEKIEGDGTDLTIASSNDLHLTATTDINIPANVGLTLGNDGEKIEGDGTDLTIASSAKLNLTATSDIHVPNNVGIVFGGDSEKIEGDGTDLTISANNLTVDAAADINLDAGGADVILKDDGTQYAAFTNSSGNLIVKSGSTTAMTFSGADVTLAGDLTVSGTTTTVNSTTVNLNDHNIVLDSGNSTSAVVNGAGITIEGGSGTDATFLYSTSGPKFELKLGSDYEDLQVDQLIAASLDISGNIDVDGTTNLDVVDIDGAVDMATTLGVTGNLTLGAKLIMPDVTDAKILVSDGTSYEEVAVSGDVTIANTGAVTIASGAVETAMIAGDAITEAKIADDAVESEHLNNNVISGQTEITSGLADADELLYSDGGTLKKVGMDTLKTYFSPVAGSSSITTTGALDSGSITSNFGSINNGSSAITTTGTVTYGSLSDGTITITAFVDEDDMNSNSATLVPTQQSVKAYVDDNAGGMSNFILEDGDGTEVTVADGKEVKFVEGGGIDIDWTDTSTGSDADPYDLTFTIKAAQTDITSIHATDLIIGEDSQTAVDFGTANEIDFKVDNAVRLTLTTGALRPETNNQIDLGTSSLEFKDAFFDGTVTSDAFAGPLTGDVTGNADTATALATGRTIAMTGDVAWTSASFDGSGNVTGSATIQADAVEQSMIADDAVGADQLAASAVVTASIVDDNVTQAKIADDAVGADQLASNAVVNASVASGAAIAFSKMANLTTGRALVSDGSGDVSVSDVTSTEVGYLDGVTSSIQTQIDAKATTDDATALAIALG